jgi:sigma-B regulation protein RsbU (phosphoserine phosphatase)
MKLRTGMLLVIVVLVAAIVASTVVAVAVVVDRAERRKLHEDLARSEQVFEDLLGYRYTMYRSDCRVVANEPRLRAVVATLDISSATVTGVIAELRSSLGSDLFLLTDSTGTLIGDALDPAATGSLAANPVIAAAIKTGEGAGIWITKGRPYQVHACRVDFAEQSVGIVLLGHVLDDELARGVHRQTGSTLIVALDAQPVAASVLAGGKPVGAAKLDAVATLAGGTAEVEVADEHYLAIGNTFPRYEGKRALTYAVLRSLDEALAPGRRLTFSVLGIAGLALIAALVLAFALARRLSRPVDDLVRFTQQIANGKLTSRAQPTGATEVRALATAMNAMVAELDKSRKSLAEKERLEREMEIAMRIQTSILPRIFEVGGLEIAARMIPATEVGGDYYDILPVQDGCWIGIGDVAGHGLTAGLEMLMVQSVVAALVRENPKAAPKNHLRVLNHVLYENIHDRLQQDEHITLTLMRYSQGVVTFAGAHEEILVCRAAGGDCEVIATPGTWLGGMRDIGDVSPDSTLELRAGDLMVLHSDGVTEARDAKGNQFGSDRLCRVIEGARTEPVEVVRDRVIAAVQAWAILQDDDISVVVVRMQPAVA